AWSAAVGGQRAGTVPARAVVQTLEDQGNRVRVFYLGDGLGHDHFDGWIDSTDLGPAGPLLVSQRYGLRMLTKEDLEAIDSGKGTWLRVPYRTQLDGGPSADANCGPAAVAMVLQYYRVASTNSEVRVVADRLQGTHDPEGGFAIEFLAGAAARFGLKPLEMEAGQDLLKKWSLDDARRQLSEGHPIIAQLRFRAMPGRELSDYGDDHYVVLAGMLGDDFIYNDSVDVDGPGYGRVISAADLKLAWGSSYFPFAGFAVSAP
ncbi:MAG TPA: C39 family peptidase, partial [Chloroflexota bacterium]